MSVFYQRRESQLFSNTRPPLRPPLCPPVPSSEFTEHLDPKTKKQERPIMKLLRTLKRLVRDEPRGSRPETKPVARICKLPQNVVMGIVANLSTQDQVSLRDTCTRFRTWSTIGYRPLHYCMIGKMTELWFISFKYPNLWLCDVCFRLHPADKRDTPRSPKRPICAQPHVDASGESAASDAFPYILSYRHLQLYLKTRRMGGCPEYTERLLQRHQVSQAVSNSRMKCTVQATFHPVALERRVVLHRSWFYRPAKETEPTPYWDMEVCPHQRYSESKFDFFEKEVPRAPGESSGPSFRVLSPQRHEYALCKAVQMAIASPNKHTFGACTLCRTDFSVQVFTLETPAGNGVRRLLLRSWQDLGGECPPLFPTWASHSHILHEHVYPSGYRACGLGNAWRLYEQEYKRVNKTTESQCAENRRIEAMYRCMEEKTQRHYPEVFQVQDDKGALKKFKKKQ